MPPRALPASFWHTLVRDLLKHWELRRDGLTPGRKREALDHVLENSRTDPASCICACRRW